jgi:hypothetical protein
MFLVSYLSPVCSRPQKLEPVDVSTCGYARSMPEESELFGAEDSISGHRLVDVRRNIGPASRTSPGGARVCAACRLVSPPEMPVCYRVTLPSPQTYWDLFPGSIRSSTRGQRRRQQHMAGFSTVAADREPLLRKHVSYKVFALIPNRSGGSDLPFILADQRIRCSREDKRRAGSEQPVTYQPAVPGDSASASAVSPNAVVRLSCPVWSRNGVVLNICITGRVIRFQSSVSFTDIRG